MDATSAASYRVRPQKAEAALQDDGRAGEAVEGDHGGGDAGLGAAATGALDGAAGTVRLDDAGAHARGDSHGVADPASSKL